MLQCLTNSGFSYILSVNYTIGELGSYFILANFMF